jgi:hypothetical protein
VSTGDNYFTAPLAALRSGSSALEALETVLACGIVNAGIGYRETKGADAFEALHEEACEHAETQGLPTKPPPRFTLKDYDGESMTRELSAEAWQAAHAGAKLLGITGGSRATDAQKWATHHRLGQVFFRIKGEWLWNAVRNARREAGREVTQDYKPLSWREFRILAALLSAKVNSYQFSFLGWQSVQARACGFHAKELFNQGTDALPAHCAPLTRQMLRDDCDKLEALGFFARCRYSKGKAGGLMAYSFRHPKRENLQASILEWARDNESFQAKTAAHRASDQEAFTRTNREPT